MEIFSKFRLIQTVSRRLIVLVLVAVAVSVAFTTFQTGTLHQQSPLQWKPSLSSRSNSSALSTHRKLLDQGVKEPARVGVGDKCTENDLVLSQGATAPLPSGIPTYTVHILNVCESGCAIQGIHLKCGWFSSARTINPKIFRRLSYDNCLVNDGQSIATGGSLSFQYANTFSYPLSISSLTCTPQQQNQDP